MSFTYVIIVAVKFGYFYNLYVSLCHNCSVSNILHYVLFIIFCCWGLALSTDKRLTPEFVAPVPIRKTRAGLQFTCAAPTLGSRDVWVCNSDGYVGQVCVLSLSPEPTVTSCNGVCNARILCIAAIPASLTQYVILLFLCKDNKSLTTKEYFFLNNFLLYERVYYIVSKYVLM